MNLYPISRGALALAILATPGTAFAAAPSDPVADPAPSDPEQDRGQTVVVTATAERDDPDRVAGGTDRVEARAFEDKVAVSLADALAFSPGVYAQPRFGQETRLSIRGSGISRGFHMRGLTLLQDGVPINLADDNGDFQELDPQVFEAIEVYRGANALRLGSSTLGGAINAVTPTGRSAPGIEVRVDGGSFDTLRGKLAYGAADAVGDVYVALTADTSSGDRAQSDRSSLRFNGNVGLRPSAAVETRFYASINHIQQDSPGNLNLNDAIRDPAKARPILIANNYGRNIDSIRLQNRTRIDLGGGALTLGAFYNHKDLYHPIFQVIDNKSDNYGAFASIDLGGTLAGGLGWEATIGSQARFGTVDAKQFVNIAGRRGARTASVVQDAYTINSFAEARLLLPGGLSLIAGTAHVAGRRTLDNLLDPTRNDEARFDAFAPKLGVLYEPVRGIQFYANHSRSVELPGFSELVQAPLVAFVPVDEQRAWTTEIGTRGTAGAVRWDVSLYRATIRGEMLQFVTGPDIPAATFNANRTLHQGVEAGLQIEFAPYLMLNQVYQYNDFRFRDDPVYRDNRLPVIPQHLYRGVLRIGTEALHVSPRVEWVPQGAWADYRNSLRVDGYATLGIGARAAINDTLTLFVDARNLTGTRAVGDISAVVAATPLSEIFYPIERRGIYGGVRARF